MTRLPIKLTTSAIALAIAAVCATPALADPTPECNDSNVQGTECGTDATAADFATAVGFSATASGVGSIAVGQTSTASGFVAVAIGQAALADADNSVAVGFLAMGNGTGATAVGAGALGIGENSVATGINAAATGRNAVAVGANTVASGENSVAIGQGSTTAEANTVSVGSITNQRRIVNVAAGVNDTDAVNVSQLTGMSSQFTAALTTETQERTAADDALRSSIATETSNRIAADQALTGRIDDLDFDIRENARDARAGTSAALAAAALPQAMDPGRSLVAGGVSTYRGKTGIAIGGSHRFSNGSAIVKVGVTYDSSEKVGANAGFGFQF